MHQYTRSNSLHVKTCSAINLIPVLKKKMNQSEKGTVQLQCSE